MSFTEEIKNRRTFAIISHPDAGKTTLTEKLLLYGGAIQIAGAVKSNKIKKTTTSDFMEIEKQRGISVATSVMSFHYKGLRINILDTPGHKDFAEDTYRTLTAVDSAILVIDSVKGVEEQTRKLMEVCRMRNTPVIVFINKLDREGKDPFDLIDEIESELHITLHPLSWPINKGTHFKGVYNLFEKHLNLFHPGHVRIGQEELIRIDDIYDVLLSERIGERDAFQLRHDVELIQGVYGTFDRVSYLAGRVCPVFFGSAVNNFGVRELLDAFIMLAPSPLPRYADARAVYPEEQKMTGFVFKIHANLDPKHRDRIAFLRVVSGIFRRNTFYYHVRLQRQLRFSNPTSFMAQDKTVIEEAYPGDVIGLYDSGNFKIGDTLTEGETLYFTGIPNFSPEIFKELINTDPLKTKQLEKGIRQLTDEGVAQLFFYRTGNRKIIGAVGELQFDVIQYRLQHEYGASCRFQPLPLYKACWITTNNPEALERFLRYKSADVLLDKDNNLVFMAQSEWMLKVAREDYPDITFHFHSEFKILNKNVVSIE